MTAPSGARVTLLARAARPPSRTRRRPRRRAARAARRSAAGPVRARGDRGADARDGALADAAHLRPPRASAPTSTSRSRARWSATRSRRRRASIRTPTRGCPSAWCGRCSTWSTRRSTSRGRRCSPRTSAASDERRARRFATVRHLAELFDRYALHRPGAGRGWAAGAADGRLAGRAVAAAARADRHARAGRAARARVRAPARASRRCSRSRRGSRCSASRACPPATSTCSPRSAAGRDVHLFLLHPSPALWERVAAVAREPVRRRADDPTATLPVEPAARLVGARRARAAARDRRPPGEHADHHHPVAHAGGTLLARIQADVRADRDARRRRRRPTPATAASRSTPATAARARSRCCATRSCTCSPTTRRSSRAT